MLMQSIRFIRTHWFRRILNELNEEMALSKLSGDVLVDFWFGLIPFCPNKVFGFDIICLFDDGIKRS